jgi:hypothetical protein
MTDPRTLQTPKNLNWTLPGDRYTLLDPVRDKTFLSLASIKNPVAPVNDGGLGVVDNGLFVYTSAYVPGTTTKRLYPIKFFWIGSPAGTTDATDTFSIYMADVNPAAYYAGAPAAVWLINPRLVLAVSQAKSDIFTWFDANYPGGAVGGVGNGNSGSNGTYGTLLGSSSPVGNISGMDSIDGQFWPIYDYVDGSCVLYFSVKTPNQNTLSIYCYKTAAGEGMEFDSPLASAQFLGGLYANGWFTNQEGSGLQFAGVNGNPNVFTSHRFSTLSPDPLNYFAGGKTKQSAVFAYSAGTPQSDNVDHGANLFSTIVDDIHAAPLHPTSSFPWGVLQLDSAFPLVDKVGSIAVHPHWGPSSTGYVVLYNSPSMIDRAHSEQETGVVISAMQLVAAYVYTDVGTPFSGSYAAGVPILIGLPALELGSGIDNVGLCRPQFTTLPDGIPKLLFANFTFDQNLTLGMTYVPGDWLSARRREKLATYWNNQNNSGFAVMLPTFGKRRLAIEGAFEGNQPAVPPVRVMGFSNSSYGGGVPEIMGYRHWRLFPGNEVNQNGLIFSGGLWRLTIDDILPIMSITTSSFMGSVVGGNPWFGYIELSDIEGGDEAPVFDYFYINSGGTIYAITTAGSGSIMSGQQTLGTFSTPQTSIPLSADGEDLLEINVNVVSLVGTGVTVALQILDPIEGTLLQTVPLGALSAAGVIRAVLARGGATAWMNGNATSLGALGIPGYFQLVITPNSATVGAVATYKMQHG